jgi:hypothetical protein
LTEKKPVMIIVKGPGGSNITVRDVDGGSHKIVEKKP